jgi:hypothetical protein
MDFKKQLTSRDSSSGLLLLGTIASLLKSTLFTLLLDCGVCFAAVELLMIVFSAKRRLSLKISSSLAA